MTRVAGKTLVLEAEKPQQCDYCGEIAELRPYGRGGACICFECGMTDERETKRQFDRRLEEATDETR